MESPYGAPQVAVGDSGVAPPDAAAASHSLTQASTSEESVINKTLGLFSLTIFSSSRNDGSEIKGEYRYHLL